MASTGDVDEELRALLFEYFREADVRTGVIPADRLQADDQRNESGVAGHLHPLRRTLAR